MNTKGNVLLLSIFTNADVLLRLKPEVIVPNKIQMPYIYFLKLMQHSINWYGNSATSWTLWYV